MKPIEQLEEQLDSFQAAERSAALRELAADHAAPLTDPTSNVNLHVHSFFSYNALGYSPSHIAWECKKTGLYAAGLCDFDVLDGLEEFLEAGRILQLRATVNVETRAFFPEFADVDINSPGEPGVTYIMAGGFVRPPAAGSPQGEGLRLYRDGAHTRNLALIERINAKLPAIAIEYIRDVMPLTPSGAATERHIVTAYIRKARAAFPKDPDLHAFWAQVLGKDAAEIQRMLRNLPACEEQVRSRLVKKGGLGYEPPSVNTFPPVDEFVRWALSCGAIPMVTWLDGSSAGEKDARKMCESLAAKGAAALNIIPDRNWNIADLKVRDQKVLNLAEIIAVAEAMGLPINIGTEMNRLGLPFVDDLDGRYLKPYKEAFLRGARIMVGHTILARYADLAYVSANAKAEFPNVQDRNRFFEAVGALPPLSENRARELEDMGPAKALATLRDAAK